MLLIGQPIRGSDQSLGRGLRGGPPLACAPAARSFPFPLVNEPTRVHTINSQLPCTVARRRWPAACMSLLFCMHSCSGNAHLIPSVATPGTMTNRITQILVFIFVSEIAVWHLVQWHGSCLPRNKCRREEMPSLTPSA
jgi:hypothetical protein